MEGELEAVGEQRLHHLRHVRLVSAGGQFGVNFVALRAQPVRSDELAQVKLVRVRDQLPKRHGGIFHQGGVVLLGALPQWPCRRSYRGYFELRARNLRIEDADHGDRQYDLQQSAH